MTGFREEIRVLLVDDEREFLEAVAPGLGRRGFEVSMADSGTAALELLANQTFDVIVLDVKMPGINGVDTFREIKRSVPDLPVILLTGHGNMDQAFETSREGVFEYLTKPCDVEKLARVARRATEVSLTKGSRDTMAVEEIRLLLVDDVRRGLKEGAFDYLTKPQRVEDLFDHIRAAWERWKRRRDEELRREAERVLEERPD